MVDLPYIDPQAIEITDSEAAEHLERVADTLRAEDFAVQAQVLRTQPAPGIVELARQTPHSLITLTTHGRFGPRPLVHG